MLGQNVGRKARYDTQKGPGIGDEVVCYDGSESTTS